MYGFNDPEDAIVGKLYVMRYGSVGTRGYESLQYHTFDKNGKKIAGVTIPAQDGALCMVLKQDKTRGTFVLIGEHIIILHPEDTNEDELSLIPVDTEPTDE